MGWNSYNHFGCIINETLIEKTATAMVSSGMKAAGYLYVNLDDCWEAPSRDANGNLVADPTNFPSGMPFLVSYVHNLGLKIGLYEDVGVTTCGRLPGSYGHYQQDANTFASWGIDYIKMDLCNVPAALSNNVQALYTQFGQALAIADPNIVYSICDWGVQQPWKWGAAVGNLWRTTDDIRPTWPYVLANLEANSAYAASAGPGGWNDPDMLEVGNGGMNATEDQAQFSMWAMMAAPLIAGNDLTNMTPATLATLTNSEVIAVDQDALGKQGVLLSDNGSGLEVWSKQVTDGTVVALMNQSGAPATITVNWGEIGLQPGQSAAVRDLWLHADLGSFSNSFSASVASHGVTMLKVSASGTAPAQTVYEADASGNTLSGQAIIFSCICLDGNSVGFLGNNPLNFLTINNVNVASGGSYGMTIYAVSVNTRTFFVSVNGAPAVQVTVAGTSSYSPVVTGMVVQLNAGSNSIQFSNPSAWAPNLEHIVITPMPWLIASAAEPTFSVPQGTYASPQLVSISDATANAVIYYTTDGSTPSTSSSRYSGPITVSSTETINAIAMASGYFGSPIASVTYTINLPPAPQSASPILQVRADAQTKTYGTEDPAFTFQYSGFTNGDTASVLSGQPVLSAPQRVRNLWRWTESLGPSTYTQWLFAGDGTSRQSNGVQLSHVTSENNFYSSISSSISALPSQIIYPGVQYLLSFYAASNSPGGDQLYWHRYLPDTGVEGWGPTALGSDVRRVVFTCVGTKSSALDCGNDPTIPLGEDVGGQSIYWLFSGANNAFGVAASSSAPQTVPADLYIGGFQVEPTVTEKRGVLAMGDSLTQYFDCLTNDNINCTSWTEFAASHMNVPFYNRGIGGQTCAQILARWPTDASPILAANASYAIIECGTNDITLSLDATQIEQSIYAMYSLAKADGAIPVVATICPFLSTASVDSAEATRQAVNAWIRAIFPLVLDFDKVVADPANPRHQNPAYIGDGTHLNLAGRIAEGNYVVQSIAGNANGYPSIWNFGAPTPYQPVLGPSSSNGMDFSPNAQREVGTYVILASAGTLASSKYRFSFSGASLGVTPAPLAVTASDKTITFGDPLPALGGAISGALAADNISATYSTTATATSVPGHYPITPALVDPKNRLSNYSVVQKPATLTILPATCAVPTFSVAAGSYNSAQAVSISDITPGAVIYYTTDGSIPTSSSTLYSGPITVSSTTTVEAIAIAPLYLNSAIATATYTILPVPVIKSLTPPYANAGGAGFNLTVNGSGFGANSVVYWASSPLVTQVASSTSLSAQVPASVIANSGIATVGVQNGAPGGNTSTAFQFEIDSSAGSTSAPIFKTAAATVAPGAAATYPVTLPSTASNVSVSCLNLPAGASCSYSSSAGAVTIDTSSATPAGAYQIVVVFTETLQGAASAWVSIPFLLISIAGGKRRRRSTRLFALLICLVATAMAFGAISGCGGASTPVSPQTHQVTSSGAVVLNVQ